MAKTYATWDSANKDSSVTLSNGDLTANQGNDGGPRWGTVRSTIGKTSGKWYWELTMTQWDNPWGGMHGICNAGFTNWNNYLGNSASGWAKIDQGFGAGKMHNGTGEDFAPTVTAAGSVMGFYLDVDAGTIGFIDPAGTDRGIMYTDTDITGGINYAATGAGGGATHMIITANFGASAFTHSVPSGYNAGLYTGLDDNTNFLTFM